MTRLLIGTGWLATILLLAGRAHAEPFEEPLIPIAQHRPSHEFDPTDAPPKSISKLLDARRGSSGRIGDLDNKLIRNLIDTFGGNIGPNDFDDKAVRDFLEKNPEFRKPENLERLRDMVQRQMKDQPRENDPKVDWNNLQERLRKIEEFRKNQKLDPINPDVRDPMPVTPQPPRVPPKNPPKKQDRQTQDFAKWMSQKFGNSPAMRDAVKDFAKVMSKNGKGPSFMSDLEKEWKKFAGSNGKDKSGSPLNNFAKDFKMPDFKSGSGGGGGNSGSGGSTGSGSNSNSGSRTASYSPGGGPSLGGLGGGSTSLIIVAVLAAAGVLFWYFYLRKKPEPRVDVDEGKKPWPVEPGLVATREDVVKAFEYLSVSKCGDEAINWHHHQIADRLGTSQNQKEAADQLAGLYERARYSPANEIFTESDIAEARARLCQLAGVPTA
jgi:hypothetical protein